MERLPFRIGHGYDVHRLVENRKLILGGVEIPYEKGLLGHSDADVLLHAVSDALLGALALGDIGKHFPDTDPAYAGADSLKLLELVVEKVREQGYRLVFGWQGHEHGRRCVCDRRHEVSRISRQRGTHHLG